MTQEICISSLVDLGFTQLEAEIYTLLTQESPATGYRIAQGIGKPAANVYKAIQTLEKKGAILVDESTNRLCRAVPFNELLNQMQRQFAEKKKRAETALANLANTQNDDRIYQLRSCEQVLERCRQMLQDAREIIVIDAFPNVLALLNKEIAKAAQRKVTVAVAAYQPTELNQAILFQRPDGQEIIQRWPGEWINLVIDGDEYLIALLDKELKKVIQAVWSSSPYLSWVYYSAVMAELKLGELEKQILDDRISKNELIELLDRFDKIFPLEAAGYKKLMQRFKQTNFVEENKS